MRRSRFFLSKLLARLTACSALTCSFHSKMNASKENEMHNLSTKKNKLPTLETSQSFGFKRKT